MSSSYPIVLQKANSDGNVIYVSGKVAVMRKYPYSINDYVLSSITGYTGAFQVPSLTASGKYKLYIGNSLNDLTEDKTFGGDNGRYISLDDNNWTYDGINSVFLTNASSNVLIGATGSDINKFAVLGNTSVTGDSKITGNLIVDGTVSAKDLYFVSATADIARLSVTSEALNFKGSVSITGDTIPPIESHLLKVHLPNQSTPVFMVTTGSVVNIVGAQVIAGNQTITNTQDITNNLNVYGGNSTTPLLKVSTLSGVQIATANYSNYQTSSGALNIISPKSIVLNNPDAATNQNGLLFMGENSLNSSITMNHPTGEFKIFTRNNLSFITFYANGVEQMRLNKNGNLTVGTSANITDYKLTVSGDSNIIGTLSATNIYASNLSALTSNIGSNISTLSSNQVTISSNLNSLSAKFVAATASLTGGTLLSKTSSQIYLTTSSDNLRLGDSTLTGMKLDVQGTSNFGNAISIGVLGEKGGITWGGVPQSLNLFSSSTINVALKTQAGEKVTVASGGNVGINTSTPNNQLSVNGTVSITGALTTTAGMASLTGGLNVRGDGTNPPITIYAGNGGQIFSIRNNGIWDVGAGTLDFTNGYSFNTSNTQRLAVQSNGNIAVGNITATERLSVTGNISLSGGFIKAPLSNNSVTANIFTSGQSVTYQKGSNYVIAYNDAGTMKYRYLVLTGTDANWTYSTIAP